MAELEREMVDVGGRQTAYFTGGRGAPLVFLHGGGIVEGVGCFAPLADHFHFIAPQMPGFDRTELRPPVQSIDGLVDHTIALLDEIGLGRFALVGHSLGGWVAASLAAANPQRVSSLVIAAPYGLDAPLANAPAMARDELYVALTNDPSIFEGLVPEGEDAEFEAARALEGASMSGFVPGPFDPTLPAKLETLPMPLLLMWGEDDRIVPIAHLPLWREALPQAEVLTYPGVGHLLYWEDPETVDAIAEFSSR
ncbi:MAG TPA: alpha/beta fold hydrolase [Solirubrobacteraceae bacterium]